MYEESLELLDKIDVEQTDREDGSLDIKVSSFITNQEIGDLCNMVTKWSPYELDGWTFWYETLSEEDLYKLFFFLDKCVESPKIVGLLHTAVKLTRALVKEILQLPCEIELETRESSYFDAIEGKLEFYLPLDAFNRAHEKMHNVIKVVGTSHETKGWIHTIHRN